MNFGDRLSEFVDHMEFWQALVIIGILLAGIGVLGFDCVLNPEAQWIVKFLLG